MIEELTLSSEDHVSVALRLPRGWRRINRRVIDGTTYSDALDNDGFVWVCIDGEWKLNLPYFRGDDLAVCRDEHGGDKLAKIDAKNRVHLPSRVVNPANWYH